ncbi:hypothetical protein NX059_009112 [Plenodomus lindquistii]|nr:hypothetical protein NX059_009112 [Plenodomus lindquistii]
MPEHPQCPGLKCHVYCNGRALNEYDPPGDEIPAPLTVVKYIIPQDDTEYLVYMEVVPPFAPNSGLLASIYVDGEYCTSGLMEKPLGATRTFLGAQWFNGAVWKLRRFRFAKVAVSENKGPKDLTHKLQTQLNAIGMIRIVFQWYKCTGVQPATSYSETKFERTGELPKKAILGDFKSHQTVLGEPESVQLSPIFHVGVKGAEFAVFEFEYRSGTPIEALNRDTQAQASRSSSIDRAQPQPELKGKHVVKQEPFVKQEPDDDIIDLTSEDEATASRESGARVVITLSSGEESDSDEETARERDTIAK